MTYKPVIIIGAPRSGTNMLRDVLCSLPKIGTWPCDEINYIWRHGNVNAKDDEFSTQMATPKASQYIRKAFDKIAKKQNIDIVIEKTCANSLRVPFVHEVLPEATYIYIYRDGADAAGSAFKRWKASLDIPYILKKARYVPLSDLPVYATKYLWNRIYRILSNEKRLSFWGPKFKGLEEALQQHTLEEVCALQWKRCVDLSEDAFKQIDAKVIRVKYEDFVTSPHQELSRILSELDVEADDRLIREAVAGVTPKSIGKGRKSLQNREKVIQLISDSLQRYGYDT